MIDHRGPEFAALFRGIRAKLKAFFQTQNEVLILTASGTGGLEAAVVNVLSPGNRVLAVTCGYFGDRFADCAKSYGAEVIRLEFPWGTAADPEAVERELKKWPDIRTVLVTHNETSTGVTNDIKAISQVVKANSQALLLVDAISSIPAIELPMDQWGLDVVIAGSQKAWMIPPGLSMVAVSQRAWEANAVAKMPRFYFDLKAHLTMAQKDQTPATPAVSLFYALETGLDLLEQEGHSNVIARHRRIGQLCRQGVRELGLEILPDEAHASNTVTAVKIPAGVDGGVLVKMLREEHKVVVGGGPGPLHGKIIRIGHLGFVSEQDIAEVVDAIAKSLSKLRGSVPAGPSKGRAGR